MKKIRKKRNSRRIFRVIGNAIFSTLNSGAVCFWLIGGIVLCCTIIGIPLGLQCFKMVKLSVSPFGKKVVRKQEMSILELVGNVIWLFPLGFLLSFQYLFVGVILCITIIGIPLGLQSFKLAKLSFMPFGTEIVDE